jgi:CRISPR-associated endoribonuclease Cas6
MTLRLRARWPLEPETRQLHGLACALFEGDMACQQGPGQEEAGHIQHIQPGPDHLGQRKPFAVWPLRAVADGSGSGVGAGAGDDAERDWVMRASWLAAAPLPPALFAPEDLRLGHVTCTVAEVTHRSVSHAQLAAGSALNGARLTFHSPTYFSQNGSDVVLPDPRLILGSWRRQWNAWIPADHALKIDDDAWRDLHRSIRLAEFDLCTRRRDSGRGHERAGFTGTAALQLSKDAPASVRSRFGTLARFAEFCGTGAQTTHGFGATTVAAGLRAS